MAWEVSHEEAFTSFLTIGLISLILLATLVFSLILLLKKAARSRRGKRNLSTPEKEELTQSLVNTNSPHVVIVTNQNLLLTLLFLLTSLLLIHLITTKIKSPWQTKSLIHRNIIRQPQRHGMANTIQRCRITTLTNLTYG